METEQIVEMLEGVAAGRLAPSEAARRLSPPRQADLGFARLDLEREARTGVPEALYAEGKSSEDLEAIVRRVVEEQGRALVTRLDHDTAERLLAAHPDARYHPCGRVLTIGEAAGSLSATVAVVSAGTSDRPVADEVAVVAGWHGLDVVSYEDMGVAGLHRLVDQLDEVRDADVLVVVAGMDGALPAVVAGLTQAAVIAVPTSVGYGASFSGLAALLAMLNACAPGVSVVNIDNGYGAAVVAVRMLRRRLR